MVEINNQRKAFLDSYGRRELSNGRRNQKSRLHRHCRRRAIYRLLRSPSQTCHAKPKTQINRRRTLPASFLLWMPTASSLAWKTFQKSGRCGIAADYWAWRFTYDWSWWYPSGNRPLQQLSGFYRRALVMAGSSIRLTAWLQNSKKRAERSERLMYEQSHRDCLRSGYLHHRLPVMGC